MSQHFGGHMPEVRTGCKFAMYESHLKLEGGSSVSPNARYMFYCEASNHIATHSSKYNSHQLDPNLKLKVADRQLDDKKFGYYPCTSAWTLAGRYTCSNPRTSDENIAGIGSKWLSYRSSTGHIAPWAIPTITVFLELEYRYTYHSSGDLYCTTAISLSL